ncbi:hypothetical protein OQA88_8132 [Cercophora sp. LCS_1]
MVKAILATLALVALATPALSACENGYTYTACPNDVVRYYDPETGELCGGLDCGGGRAPPKTDVPGCPLYSGTSTRATSASYLWCFTPSGASTTASSSVSSTTTGSSTTGSGGATTTPTAAPSTTQPSSGSGTGTATAPPAGSTNAGYRAGGSLLAAVAGVAGAVIMI